jgi:hypothetical protein
VLRNSIAFSLAAGIGLGQVADSGWAWQNRIPTNAWITGRRDPANMRSPRVDPRHTASDHRQRAGPAGQRTTIRWATSRNAIGA